MLYLPKNLKMQYTYKSIFSAWLNIQTVQLKHISHSLKCYSTMIPLINNVLQSLGYCISDVNIFKPQKKKLNKCQSSKKNGF